MQKADDSQLLFNAGLVGAAQAILDAVNAVFAGTALENWDLIRIGCMKVRMAVS